MSDTVITLSAPIDWVAYLRSLSARDLAAICEGRVRPGRSDDENLLVWNLAIDEENER